MACLSSKPLQIVFTLINLRALGSMALVRSTVYETLRINSLMSFQYAHAKEDLVVESHEGKYEVGWSLHLRNEATDQDALFIAENFLLCAPTCTGKTNVALLIILHQIALNRNAGGSIDLNKLKIVYVAPMKALVAELVGDLSHLLQSYGITVRELFKRSNNVLSTNRGNIDNCHHS
ncbi:hypothetical protein SUGI_0846720 [Cryptomeria japonica]|nr:hypothetical protein SUGI_0846720 [Cryptomeria japonica]